VNAIERQRGWRVIELPYRASGAIPARYGMESLDGVVAWVDRKHSWLEEMASAGIPVVNCGGDWNGTAGIGSVAVKMATVLDLAIEHLISLGLPKIYFFGHRVSGCKHRLGFVDAIRQRVSALGIEVSHLETKSITPDEDLSLLLAPNREKRLYKQFEAFDEPVAMLCENDFFGLLACDIAAGAGLHIPTDLAVLSGNESSVGRYSEPTISGIRLPGIEIGELAFDLIARAHDGEALPTKIQGVPARDLIVRESTGGPGLDVGLESVNRRIQKGAVAGLNFGELPALAGLSAKVLRRRYREVYGEEPSAQIQRLRLDEAKRLLGTDLTVVEVATACGFASLSAFSNFFVRHEGHSPSEFRKSLQDL
jgi:LacI family transcriptional regulator